MKKILSAVLLAAFFVMVLAGCGSSAASAAKDYDINAIEAAIEKVNTVSNPRDIDDFSVENDFGLSSDLVSEYVGVISNDQNNSAMILVVKASDGKGEDVKKALETYKANQETFFGNYPEFAEAQAQVADGRIVQEGDVVVITFANTEGADYSAIDSAISEALK